MTTTLANGRPHRKQLSDQIDRLDGIIDALADGLNQAVISAAREGTRSAVKEILTELLTNPDILAMIRAASGPQDTKTAPVDHDRELKSVSPTLVTPSSISQGQFVVAAITTTAKGMITTAVAKVTSAWRGVTETAQAVWHSPLWNRAVVLGAGVGLATAVIASSNHTLAAALGGVAAAATAVSVQVGSWFRTAGRRLGLA